MPTLGCSTGGQVAGILGGSLAMVGLVRLKRMSWMEQEGGVRFAACVMGTGDCPVREGEGGGVAAVLGI